MVTSVLVDEKVYALTKEQYCSIGILVGDRCTGNLYLVVIAITFYVDRSGSLYSKAI